MVNPDPWDVFIHSIKPDLELKYPHGPSIDYYTWEQMLQAFAAGRNGVIPPCKHEFMAGSISFGPDGYKSEMHCQACGAKFK